uniref:SCP domain-containing protein n=1 Tax=Anolis carolinensis TaxID=28377 RepID=A0A803TI85_ANOCA
MNIGFCSANFDSFLSKYQHFHTVFIFYTVSASKQFADEVLKAHNDYRKKHGVPSLKLCKNLSREAQQYSEALASTRILKHSPESSKGKCGENLAWASYDQSGHFTAMVWKSTKKMGVGKAAASDGSTFVVARYVPAGNIVNPGQYEQNVLPPKK